MVDITLRTTLMGPPNRVFEYLADMTNEPAWHTDVLEVKKTSAGSIGAGTTFDVRLKPSMGVSRGVVELVGYETDRQIVQRGRFGNMETTVTNTLNANGASTDLVRRIQVRTRGLMMWLMQPVMGMMVRRRNRVFLANLARLLEKRQSDRTAYL